VEEEAQNSISLTPSEEHLSQEGEEECRSPSSNSKELYYSCISTLSFQDITFVAAE
jgi:hypothetical protein